VVAVVADAEGCSTLEVAERLTWSRPWDQSRGLVRRSAIGETYAHLFHLEQRGRLTNTQNPMITGTWSIQRREHHKSLTAQLRVCQSHVGGYIVLACTMVQLSMRTPTRCSTRTSRLSTPLIRPKNIDRW
jgi:hypothetical protein